MKEKIANRSARVVVIGGGYVGQPLAVEIAKAGFAVTIYDTSPDKVRALEQLGVPATGNPEIIGAADIVLVCVPTPLNKTNDPDNSFVIAAVDQIMKHTDGPTLIVLESTTFPGFTREVVAPKLSFNPRLHLAFSPERVDPGNQLHGIKNTPKIVGGSTAESLALATAFYGTFVDQVVPVSSTDAAEMVKLLENTFRAVNIGLVNEIAVMCRHLGLNVWELIDAAATKPFGFMPFYPGPGLGGHCIPIDPLYLAWKLRTLKYTPRFIELANDVNRSMPAFVVQRVADALNDRMKSVNGSLILIVGVAYKRDVDDVRESPAFDVIEQLLDRGANVEFYDTHVPALALKVGSTTVGGITDATWPRGLSRYDCAVIVTDHSNVDYRVLVERSQIVVDCRNTTKGIDSPNIVRL